MSLLDDAQNELKASLESTIKANLIAGIQAKKKVDMQIASLQQRSLDISTSMSDLTAAYDQGKFVSEYEINQYVANQSNGYNSVNFSDGYSTARKDQKLRM